MLVDTYLPSEERTKYLVNIGAQDGKKHDPTYPLLSAGYSGALFEGDQDYKEALYANVAALPTASDSVNISWGYLSLETAANRFEEAGVQKVLDCLKVDIDSYDAQLLEKVLDEGYTPKVIMVEFNPDIPPPFAWAQLSPPSPFPHNFKKATAGNYGASASYWHSLLTETHGYGLVGMEVINPGTFCPRCEHNMWYVSGDLLNAKGFRKASYSDLIDLYWAVLSGVKYGCLHAVHPCPNDLIAVMDSLDSTLVSSLSAANKAVTLPALSRLMSSGDCRVREKAEEWAAENIAKQMDKACMDFNGPDDPCVQDLSLLWMEKDRESCGDGGDGNEGAG